MPSHQTQRQPLICVSALVPVQLENQLHRTAATMRNHCGMEYSETFTEVISLGIEALNERRASTLSQCFEAISRAQS